MNRQEQNSIEVQTDDDNSDASTIEIEKPPTSERGVQTSIQLNFPLMLQSLNHQYKVFIGVQRSMKKCVPMYKPQHRSHLKLMLSIDQHFLNQDRATDIDPILVNAHARYDENATIYHDIDKTRMNLLGLEIQRIKMELKVLRTNAHRITDGLRMGCLLCDKTMASDVLFTSGKCGHIYCDKCYVGITRRGVNRNCPFDRSDLVHPLATFKLTGFYSGTEEVLCAACEIPFNLNDHDDKGIYALPSCGHMFHDNCKISNMYQCAICAKNIDGDEVKLFAAFY